MVSYFQLNNVGFPLLIASVGVEVLCIRITFLEPVDP